LPCTGLRIGAEFFYSLAKRLWAAAIAQNDIKACAYELLGNSLADSACADNSDGLDHDVSFSSQCCKWGVAGTNYELLSYRFVAGTG
jgi:hypothetical protein